MCVDGVNCVGGCLEILPENGSFVGLGVFGVDGGYVSWLDKSIVPPSLSICACWSPVPFVYELGSKVEAGSGGLSGSLSGGYLLWVMSGRRWLSRV